MSLSRAVRCPLFERLVIGAGIVSCALYSQTALSASLTGSADIGRIKPPTQQPAPDHSEDEKLALPAAPAVEIPHGAKDIHLTLRGVTIEGATVFTQEQLRDIYAGYLNKPITLDAAYYMAGALTERYRNAGYFLSLAYLPDQDIDGGKLIIRVVEGHIAKVELEGSPAEYGVVKAYIAGLTAKKPVTSAELESFLLRMNDLPGYHFRTVLAALPGGKEGEVKLTLSPVAKKGKGNVSADNFSSRYLGPHELSANYSASLLPLQQTSVSGLTSVPFKKLYYGAVNHTFFVAPQLMLAVDASLTKAQPGYTLENLDVESQSIALGTSLIWQAIRQREENLSLKITLDGRNTHTDLLSTAFTRDRVRALRGNATYDRSDTWNGLNFANATISHGLSGLGANNASDINLSRAEAKPDFIKMELWITRLQSITDDWSLLMTAAGQWSNSPLYSSEEFGYGGQAFGRAYDASEITGDDGAAGSIELRYGGLSPWNTLTTLPYAFYDVGTVWNEDAGQEKRASGASAGFGLRASAPVGLVGNVGVAWPLTRPASVPFYGQETKSPRLYFQVSQEF